MRRLLSFLILFGFSCTCPAKVALKSTKRLIIPVDNVTPKITSEDVAKVIPLDLKEGDSQGTVFGRIADRGFSLWFNSSFVKSSALGQMAERTQEKLKTDVVVPAGTPNGVSHKFSFRVEAFQALAKLEYSGWLKASVNYDAKASCTDILFKEKVLENKDLVVSHKVSKEEGLSMVGLGWSF
ncbi:hypothetical protein AZI86_08590 [Bdellovibrio bacteriovorus]|uniref:Lipoprotein n=1 Tax=Bdellovibrio bacteriovorus TaxID=959 RepID=A0A150WRJ4_BDEBC|nr:hypothetical protein [Bdellovibrio bacteriovorus]KYG67060.1 hypothetical protein AZI86_08590 [Bdellovibrio bacteriovorus]